MSNLLPSEAIANEVFGLGFIQKSMLLHELTDSVLESQEGLKALQLSADATQWAKSLTTIETLTIIECLAHSLQAQLICHQEQELANCQISFAEYRKEQGHESCPCGDMDVLSCSGECEELEDILLGEETFISVLPRDLTGIDLDTFDY